MANLYDKAGLVNIPVGYQDGFLYNIKPEDNTLGFRFNRDSAATRVNKEGLIEQVGYFGPELVQNGNFSELGPELIVNGDFATDSDWIKGTGWSISGGSANCDGSQTSGTFLQQTPITFTSGKTYKVVFTCTIQAGNLDARLQGSGATVTGTSRASSGTYTEYLVSTGNTSFRMRGNADFIGSIDNISVKQVDPNDYWELSSQSEFTSEGARVYSSDGSFQYIQQQGIFETNKTYKLELDIISSNGATLGFAGGIPDISNTSTLGKRILYVSPTTTYLQIKRSSGVTDITITNISVVEVKGDKPRIDYTDSLTSPSLLLEPQSTNLVTFSEDFSQSVWQKTDVSITSGFLAPDGSTNAYKIEKTGSANTGIVYGFSGQNTNKTKSIWAKTVSGTGKVTLLNNNTDTNALFDITEEWQRFDITHNSADFFYAVDFRNASATLTEVLIWGAQLEALSYATSYIPTAGSTVTRAEETCVGAGNASTFNSTEGVLYAEIAALADSGQTRRISLSDGSSNNRVTLMYVTSNNSLEGFVVSSGATQYYFSETITNVLNFNKIAVKYKANDFALWINGVEYDVDTSGSAPIGLNELSFDNGISADNFYGKTKGVYVFNEALTDDELQQLTGPEYNSFAALAAAYNYTVI